MSRSGIHLHARGAGPGAGDGDRLRAGQGARGREQGQPGSALHADDLVQAGQLRELAALGADLLGLVMPGQAALDELHTALLHVGDVDRVLMLQTHDRGYVSLGVDFHPTAKTIRTRPMAMSRAMTSSAVAIRSPRAWMWAASASRSAAATGQ